MQKLARAVIGTNNIDNCSRYCQAPATTGLFRTVGYGGDSGSIADIEKADLVIIVGSNTAESHPVLATRVKRAHKLRGQKLIVSDLREHEMARRADLFLHPTPGHRSGLALGRHAATCSTTAWRNTEFLERVGQRTGRIREEPGAVHAGIRRADLRSPGRNAEAGGAHDRRGRAASAFCGRWA